MVNVVCALILGDAHDHHDDHASRAHDHDHHHGHAHGDDLNLKSAYLHVIADAATSVLAIVALAGGWLYGWSWLDPVMGIVGAVLVAVWAKGLIIETGKVLLDREMDHPVVDEIREVVETGRQPATRASPTCTSGASARAPTPARSAVVTHDRQLTPARVRDTTRGA